MTRLIRIFLLYAILIFAKKAPKMITDLLNIKSEGIGLKGLNIKNKMGEAAIVGGAVKKGMSVVHGKVRQGAVGFASGYLNGKGNPLKKDGIKSRLKSAGKGLATGFANGGAAAAENLKNGRDGLEGLAKSIWTNTKEATRGKEPTFLERIGAKFDSLTANIGSLGFSGLDQARAGEMKEMQNNLGKKVGKEEAIKIVSMLNHKHNVNGRIDFHNDEEFERYKKDLKAITEAYSADKMYDILFDMSSVTDPSGALIGNAGGLAAMDAYASRDRLSFATNAMDYIDVDEIDKKGSSLLFRKDLLVERGKALDKINTEWQSYLEMQQADPNNTVKLQERLVKVQKAIKSADDSGVFNEKYGVDALNLSLDVTTDPTTGATTYGVGNLGDIGGYILTNNKKIKGVENDIARMQTVEPKKSDDK